MTSIIDDQVADADEAKNEYGINIEDLKEIDDADCLVAPDIFKKMRLCDLDALYGNTEKATRY